MLFYFDKYSKTRFISTVRPNIRLWIQNLVINMVNTIYGKPSNKIYIKPMRRLNPMLYNFINDQQENLDINLVVPFPETNLSSLLFGDNYSNPFRFLIKLVKLAKEKIFLKQSIYILSPRNGIFYKILNH